MSRLGDLARRLAALPFWYVTRRFATLQDHLDQRMTALGERFEAAADPDRMAGSLHRELGDIHLAQEHLERLARRPPWAELVGSPVAKLDEMSAAFLNYGGGRFGFAAQAGLWFPPEVALAHSAGSVEVLDIDHRVVSMPYVHRALAAMADGAAILDVGAATSPLAFALASSGYRVTAVDPAPYPLKHPAMRWVESRIEDWDGPAEGFDGVIVHSVLEHVGGGPDGRPGGDADAEAAVMAKLRGLAREGALLVLVVPFGARVSGGDHRVYDEASLGRVLDGWQVSDRRFARRVAEHAWAPCSGEDASRSVSVAMVTATRR